MDRPSAGSNFPGKKLSQNPPVPIESSGRSAEGNGILHAGAPSTASSPAGDDFLTRLLARNISLGSPGNTLKPRLLSRFEPESTQSAPFTPEFLELNSSDSAGNLSSPATDHSYPGRSGSYSIFRQSQPGLEDRTTSASPLIHLLEQYTLSTSQGPDQDRTSHPVDIRLSELAGASENTDSQSLLSKLDEMSSSNNRGHHLQPLDAQQSTGSWISALQSEVGDHPAPFVHQSRGLQNPAVSGSLVSGSAPSMASLAEGNSSPSAPPPIQVTIGRVEVRFSSPAVAGRMKTGPESRSLPLEDYLRSGGPR